MKHPDKSQPAQKPDIEFRRKLGIGHYRSYGHIYFHPLKIFLFGKKIWGYKP